MGTEVSAKYKGAFCEAKVRKVVKNIKCKVSCKCCGISTSSPLIAIFLSSKVMFKPGLGSALVSDDQIKGLLRVCCECGGPLWIIILS